MTVYRRYCCIACLLLAFWIAGYHTAQAASYQFVPSDSVVSFAGTHAGKPFQGRFETLDAEIVFDPKALADSTVTVTFDTASARTGDALYDGTLPQADWFNVKAFPTAVFQSTRFEKAPAPSADTYRVEGKLTIRGIERTIAFPIRLSGLGTAQVTAEGQMPLNRLDFDIGRQSDPTGEWVSPTITVTLRVVANAVTPTSAKPR